MLKVLKVEAAPKVKSTLKVEAAPKVKSINAMHQRQKSIGRSSDSRYSNLEVDGTK
jgi:hypothetical protein